MNNLYQYIWHCLQLGLYTLLANSTYPDLGRCQNQFTYVLGSEIWEEIFVAFLSLVNEFIIGLLEIRNKYILHGDDSCPGQVPSQSSAGDLGPLAGVGGFRVGKLGKFAHSHNEGKLREGNANYNDVHSSANVCSSTHYCGRMVNGSTARIAYCVLY